MKAIYRGVACTELFNKKFEVPEHKTRTFEKTSEEVKKALKIEEDRKKGIQTISGKRKQRKDNKWQELKRAD